MLNDWSDRNPPPRPDGWKAKLLLGAGLLLLLGFLAHDFLLAMQALVGR